MLPSTHSSALEGPGSVTSWPGTEAWHTLCHFAASVADVTAKYIHVLISTEGEEGTKPPSVVRWSWATQGRTAAAAPPPHPEAGREAETRYRPELLFLRPGVQNGSKVHSTICPLKRVSHPCTLATSRSLRPGSSPSLCRLSQRCCPTHFAQTRSFLPPACSSPRAVHKAGKRGLSPWPLSPFTLARATLFLWD